MGREIAPLLVKVRRSGFGMVRSGGVSFGEVRRSRLGLAGCGPSGCGRSRRSRLGEEGWARKVKAVEARSGLVRRVEAV